MRLLKVLLVLVVLAFVALTGYAYLGDMAPRQEEIRQPVSLDTSGVTSPSAAGATSGNSSADGAEPDAADANAATDAEAAADSTDATPDAQQ
ncbi:hypothetical protein [Paracoccus sediminicola]|uniref:hypothetical protein n=1 Tax=Paracoccus sediminicola TaxID=3017783 RepID=UPI0022F03474|nr:hypothetical protein [Paracoccus sediminicola]WBU58095.1 hypothetical protein PAF18_06635 [Paracoccus sediminicola]